METDDPGAWRLRGFFVLAEERLPCGVTGSTPDSESGDPRSNRGGAVDGRRRGARPECAHRVPRGVTGSTSGFDPEDPCSNHGGAGARGSEHELAIRRAKHDA